MGRRGAERKGEWLEKRLRVMRYLHVTIACIERAQRNSVKSEIIISDFTVKIVEISGQYSIKASDEPEIFKISNYTPGNFEEVLAELKTSTPNKTKSTSKKGED